MPGRKKTLQSQPFDDILLLGISTTLPDYKLVWHLNRQLDINLIKYNNIYPDPHDRSESYSFYLFDQGENLNVFNLVALNNEGKRWMKLPVNTDFLFIIRNALDQDRLDFITQTIRNILHITYAFTVDPNKIKSIDIMLETIEFHEMEIMKERHQRFPKNKR